LALSSAAALWAALGGCATVHTINEQGMSAALTSAPAVYVLPLSVEAQPAEEPVRWMERISAWSSAYLEYLVGHADKAGRAVVAVAPGQPVGPGLLVAAHVIDIRRAAFMGLDDITADVQFLDPRTGGVVFAARVRANSRRAGWENYTFGGRVKNCSINLANAILFALANGHFP
jgi:hypothetical protein